MKISSFRSAFEPHHLVLLLGVPTMVVGILFLTLKTEESAPTLVIGLMGALVAGLICLHLRCRIWLLLPFMMALSINLPLPGAPNTGFLAQVLVISFLTLFILARAIPATWEFGELEIWCLLLLCCVAQAYLRNPVGLNIFGGSTVGGKAYVFFAVSFLCAALLSRLRLDPYDLRWWIRLTLIGSLLNFLVGGAAALTGGGARSAVSEGKATRVQFVRGISSTLSLWIASHMSPFKAALHPVWAPLILLSLAGSAFSGFRSDFALVGLTYLVGLCYRGAFRQVSKAVVLGVVVLALLAIINQTTPLPPNIQRALSFLPGTWEERYLKDASNSTEWRVELWKAVLTNERYLSNKWIGDGLGFTTKQLERMKKGMRVMGRSSGFDAHRESILINAGYHSGPIETIRAIGFVGLIVLLLGFCRLAIHAHRQIVRCRDTEWFPVALFIGIPLIYGPFFWVFIFGTFAGGASMLLMGTALVRILENNLPVSEDDIAER